VWLFDQRHATLVPLVLHAMPDVATAEEVACRGRWPALSRQEPNERL
jgi:hypothetical protein